MTSKLVKDDAKPIEKMNLTELADEIYQRSWVMAKAPKKMMETNEYTMKLLTPHVWRQGRHVMMRYGNEDAEPLTKEEAMRYLHWLRSGNVGTHRDASRFFERNPDA